jgi:hypothetical protein
MIESNEGKKKISEIKECPLTHLKAKFCYKDGEISRM